MYGDIRRISNECSEELIHRHDPNSLLDTLVPAFFYNQIIIRKYCISLQINVKHFVLAYKINVTESK
jgi:hypothetical protein